MAQNDSTRQTGLKAIFGRFETLAETAEWVEEDDYWR